MHNHIQETSISVESNPATKKDVTDLCRALNQSMFKTPQKKSNLGPDVCTYTCPQIASDWNPPISL